ncbi:hypothetical protein [Planococcus lenghuensis]|uniref:Uncharacterized protein n=1 Tax=Planococcus lenghuensis TaxID=2213202 RepID=A0A1Q2KYR5_9BACL|nr:hypothetical protein [Planococcus lenghuensis]AQQ53365.1 hypothetical protein B0X71_09945 [Planococcus lenghuensis]
MVVEDLLALPDSSPILVEGSVVMPKQVAPLLLGANQAIWLFPTPEFQVSHYSKREWIHQILEQTEEPSEAFRSWIQKEMGFAEKIHKDPSCTVSNRLKWMATIQLTKTSLPLTIILSWKPVIDCQALIVIHKHMAVNSDTVYCKYKSSAYDLSCSALNSLLNSPTVSR